MSFNVSSCKAFWYEAYWGFIKYVRLFWYYVEINFVRRRQKVSPNIFFIYMGIHSFFWHLMPKMSYRKWPEFEKIEEVEASLQSCFFSFQVRSAKKTTTNKNKNKLIIPLPDMCGKSLPRWQYWRRTAESNLSSRTVRD